MIGWLRLPAHCKPLFEAGNVTAASYSRHTSLFSCAISLAIIARPSDDFTQLLQTNEKTIIIVIIITMLLILILLLSNYYIITSSLVLLHHYIITIAL